MNLARSCWLGLLILVSATSAFAQTEAGVARMKAGTLVVLCSQQGGDPAIATGFLVGDGSYAITNMHTFAKANPNDCAVAAPGFKSAATVKDLDPKIDLVLLKLAQPSGKPGVVFTGLKNIEKGQAVVAVGYPDKEGYDASQGTIEGGQKTDGGAVVLKTSLTFSARNTGGPLFTNCGEVAGINLELKSAKDLAMASESAYAMLKKNGVQFKEASAACTATAGAGGGGTGTDEGGSGGSGGGGDTQKPRSRGPVYLFQYFLANMWYILGAAAVIIAAVTFLKKKNQPAATAPAGAPSAPNGPSGVRRVALVGVAGPVTGERFPLSYQGVYVGRDPNACQLVVPANTPEVSRQHCSVRLDGDGSVLVEDCDSSNGTFLSTGEKLPPRQPRRLRVRERFYLGTHSAAGFQVEEE